MPRLFSLRLPKETTSLLCLYDCFGSPGGSLPWSFRLTCCARDLSAGCSCPFSSSTRPCCAALRSGFGMPACPPCLPPISFWPSKSFAFDISTLPVWIGALTSDQRYTLLQRNGVPSLLYWKTAPAAGQRLEPLFMDALRGIATPPVVRTKCDCRLSFQPLFSFPENRMLDR
jgi:hypothetical protein